MQKRFAFIIAILIALTIGTVQTVRINQTYFPEPVAQQVVEDDYAKFKDSKAFEELQQAFEIPDTSSVHPSQDQPPTSSGVDWQPSHTALEAKFWMDSIASFLTALAPILIPLFAYRNRKEKKQT